MIKLQSSEFGFVPGQHLCISRCYFKAANAEGSYNGQETEVGLQHIMNVKRQHLLIF
jgi:hypothetical protein